MIPTAALAIISLSFVESAPPAYCIAPLNKSDCGLEPTPVFSYYQAGSRCEIEVWRGCPTLNRFKSQWRCHDACIATLLPRRPYKSASGKYFHWNDDDWLQEEWFNDGYSYESIDDMFDILDHVLNDIDIPPDIEKLNRIVTKETTSKAESTTTVATTEGIQPTNNVTSEGIQPTNNVTSEGTTPTSSTAVSFNDTSTTSTTEANNVTDASTTEANNVTDASSTDIPTSTQALTTTETPKTNATVEETKSTSTTVPSTSKTTHKPTKPPNVIINDDDSPNWDN